MQIKQSAMAGTLESSDVQVTIEPHEGSVEIELESSVMLQYGRQIKACVQDTLKRLNVNDVRVTVVDKGALECTIKARVQCAVYRAAGVETGFPWGGAIQ
ncbi:MAG TPA: citrate lyase acyl carrier protein [Clostridiales bacterium]|jgi:citrate lyase subunit gamma (acyl carrier protein)|nr:citrate lyase acyl carrier protein [Clostridiales bacterium]